MRLEAGTSIGDYRTIGPIGRGGMGEVWLARDTRLGRRVALKFLAKDRLSTPKFVKQFLLEARATARLNHPHIVTVFGVGEVDGTPYLAMEYLEGETLQDRMRGERLGVREIVRVGHAIAQALAAAHAEGVLHRDLKPANVLLPRDGRLRVVDFGIAQLLGAARDEVQAEGAALSPLVDGAAGVEGMVTVPDGAAVGGFSMPEAFGGTPAYMAPEQWRGEDVSGTDVWALGVILHELVVGRRPYVLRSVDELARQVLSDDPVPVAEELRDVPAALADLVRGCLEKAPRARPSAERAVEVLAELLARRRAEADGEGPFRGLLPFSERHAHLFFGRDDEVEQLVESLRERVVIPVVGPSGSGKSSFVRAGLVPRLREQGSWIVLSMRPGPEPFRQLAHRITSETTSAIQPTRDLARTMRDMPELVQETLALELPASPGKLAVVLADVARKANARVLLVIDQLEELSTHVGDEATRDAFLTAICSAADDPVEPVRVVYTVRDDFLAEIARNPRARETLGAMRLMQSPGADALLSTLIEPVEAVGYAFDDPSLPAQMVRAVVGEAAALPLLQFSLQQLWEDRDRERRWLLRATYDRIGGVAGALADHADQVLHGLTELQVALARELLLRLVTDAGTRRIETRERLLDGLPGAASAVLDRLAESRLLTIRKDPYGEGGIRVELAHESLVFTWGRLARWIESGREQLVVLAEARQAAELWERRGRRAEELWRGAALADVRRGLEGAIGVPALVTEFLAAGEQLDRRGARRVRLTRLAAIVVLALIAAGSSLAAWGLSRERSRAEAGRAEVLVEGGRAALALGDPLEARARLRSALEIGDVPLARALFFQLDRESLQWRRELGGVGYGLAFSPDGETLAVGGQRKLVYLVDRVTGAIDVLRGHRDQVIGVAYSPDGARLASGSWDGDVFLWDVAARRGRRVGRHREGAWSVAFHPTDGTFLSAGADGSVRRWDARTGELRGEGPEGSTAYVVVISPDGTRAAVGRAAGRIDILDGRSLEPERAITVAHADVQALAFDPAGARLAVGGDDGEVVVVDAASGELAGRVSLHDARVSGVRFRSDGGLVWATRDGAVHLLPEGAADPLVVERGEPGWGVAVDPSGRFVAASGWRLALYDAATLARGTEDGARHGEAVIGFTVDRVRRGLVTVARASEALVWDLVTGRARRVPLADAGRVEEIEVAGDGQLLTVNDVDGAIRIFDWPSATPAGVVIGHAGRVTGLAVDDAGARAVTCGLDRAVVVYDLAARAVQATLHGHEEACQAVAMSASGDRIVSGSSDATVRVWEIADGTSRVLSPRSGPIREVAITGDGARVAAVTSSGRVWIEDEGTPDGGRTLGDLERRCIDITFDEAGERLAVGCADGGLFVWDVDAPEPVPVLAHRRDVNRVGFVGDGLVSLSDDGTTRLFDAEGRPVWRGVGLVDDPPRTFGHRGWLSTDGGEAPPVAEPARRLVEAATLASEDSERTTLCTWAGDGTVTLFDLSAAAEAARARWSGAEDLRAARGACLGLSGDRLERLVAGAAEAETVATGVGAFALDGDAVLVSTAEGVVVHDRAGARPLADAPGGASSLARLSGGALAIGFPEGFVELRARGVRVRLEETPSSPAVRITDGPPGTVVVGFADGSVGLWRVEGGRRLAGFAVHGPVRALVVRDLTLHVVSELGDVARRDLSVFAAARCELLREVWRRVPVVWEGGAARRRLPPGHHACR